MGQSRVLDWGMEPGKRAILLAQFTCAGKVSGPQGILAAASFEADTHLLFHG